MASAPQVADVLAMEQSAARDTLVDFPGAVGAYDQVPFQSASFVFTMDTSTDILLLHSIQVRPASCCMTHIKLRTYAAFSSLQQHLRCRRIDLNALIAYHLAVMGLHRIGCSPAFDDLEA